MTKPLPTTGLLSVYAGQQCIGHLIRRGKAGVEAFDVEDRSLGIFSSQHEAIKAVAAIKGPAS
jgi:hypothetical protein